MPQVTDPFPAIALKCAKSLQVQNLFGELALRAEKFARMHEDFSASLRRNHEARRRKPLELSDQTKTQLLWAESINAQLRDDMEKWAAAMDDTALLQFGLTNLKNQLDIDKELLPQWHEDDKPAAKALIEFNRETVKIVELFMESFLSKESASETSKSPV